MPRGHQLALSWLCASLPVVYARTHAQDQSEALRSVSLAAAFVMTEMLGRQLRHELNERWRLTLTALRQTGTANDTEQALRATTVDFLNEVFDQSARASAFWAVFAQRVRAVYKHGCEDLWTDSAVTDMRTLVSPAALLLRLLALIRAEMTTDTLTGLCIALSNRSWLQLAPGSRIYMKPVSVLTLWLFAWFRRRDPAAAACEAFDCAHGSCGTFADPFGSPGTPYALAVS